jgi:hypothetical protein
MGYGGGWAADNWAASDQQLRPDVGHATGIRQNLGVGFGLGLDAVMANVIRHVSELPGSPEEQGLGVIQQDPARSMAIYSATLTAMNKFLMIDKLAPPETFADALARAVGESGVPLAETMALSYLTAGVMNPLTAGIAQKVPYLYSWLFPIARDAITFGAQSALEPGATAKGIELGAGTGAIMGMLGPYGKLTRAIGGAALGIGQEYMTNPQAQPMDYARNAALMGAFAAIGGAHGITADEAAAGTILDWAKEKGYSDEALARAIKSQGIGAIANEFAEDMTALQMENRSGVIEGSGPGESGAIEHPAETSVRMDKVGPQEAEIAEVPADKASNESLEPGVPQMGEKNLEGAPGFEAKDVREVEEAEPGLKRSSSPYRQLEKALEADGEPRPPGHAGHHIVALNDPRAAHTQDILKDFDIPVNSADNGVWLPRLKGENAGPGAYHPELNTTRYHTEVDRRLSEATSREKCLEVLQKIKKELSDNTFPYQKAPSN